MIKNGKISLEEIADYIPVLLLDTLKQLESLPPRCDPRGALLFHRTHFPMK